MGIQDKAYRIWDENGLLKISPAGGKLWRFKYRFVGKEKRLSIEQWPEVKLAETRDMRDAARQVLRQNQDPALNKKRDAGSEAHTFMQLGVEWLQGRTKFLSPQYILDTKRRLEQYVYPYFGQYTD